MTKDVRAGRIVVKVGLAAVRPAEFIPRERDRHRR